MSGRRLPPPTSYTHTVMLGLILAFTLITLVLVPAEWGWESKWNGIPTSHCNDFDPCTRDLILPDDTCITRPKRNGTDCTVDDQCYTYNALNRKTCNNGACVGNVTDCKGYCVVDDDCVALPLKFAEMDGVVVETFCLAQSCVTTIVGGYTPDCESWIDTMNNVSNQYIPSCLFSRFDNFDGNFTSGVCLMRYNCAPFTFIEEAKKRSLSDDVPPVHVAPVLPGNLAMSFSRDPLSPSQYLKIKNRIAESIAKALAPK